MLAVMEMARGASRMVQWLKTFSAKPYNRSSIPGPVVWKERTDSYKVSSDFYKVSSDFHWYTYQCPVPKTN